MHSGKSRIAIACTTYNHEKYIARAIESFLMQQVSEPFEIHICDDASTDNTQAIITAYQKKISAYHQSEFTQEKSLAKGIRNFKIRFVSSNFSRICRPMRRG